MKKLDKIVLAVLMTLVLLLSVAIFVTAGFYTAIYVMDNTRAAAYGAGIIVVFVSMVRAVYGFMFS